MGCAKQKKVFTKWLHTAFLLTCIWQLKYNKIPVVTMNWAQLWYCQAINWLPETKDNVRWESWLLITYPLQMQFELFFSLSVNHMHVVHKQIKFQKKNAKCLCFGIVFIFVICNFLVFIEIVIWYLSLQWNLWQRFKLVITMIHVSF